MLFLFVLCCVPSFRLHVGGVEKFIISNRINFHHKNGQQSGVAFTTGTRKKLIFKLHYKVYYF